MKKWIQKATARMKKKGTEGSFRRYCGGKVTMDCIQRGLNSNDPKIRAKARFAKAMMKINKESGGEVNPSAFDVVDQMKADFIDGMMDASLENFVNNIHQAFAKNQGYDMINSFAGELLRRKPVKAEGGDIVTQQQVPEQQQTPQEQQQMQQQGVQAGQQQLPNISYEEYVSFVMSYPEYFKRLLADIQAAQEQVNAQVQSQGQQQIVTPEQEQSPEMVSP